MKTNCPVCDAEIVVDDNSEIGELIECDDCGVEPEIVSLTPLQVKDAPQEEEDWGE